jgi:uncharacterized protein YprB with RNaseH-like and TPR domain
MNKLDKIFSFLREKPGYLKEGKRRLKRILKKNGINASLEQCAYALREFTNQSNSFKRLFFDIETSPNIGLFWRAGYNLTITPESIIQEKAVICVSYKWEFEDKVYHLKWTDGDDTELLKAFTRILLEADEVVAHNGDRFDIAWLRTRCAIKGLPFPTYLKSLDTLQKVKRNFNFNSNKLDYLAKVLQVGGKIETGGYNLWKRIVLDNDKESLDKMLEYCDNDVVILEDVFHKLQSYIKPNTHVGTHVGNGKHSCPTCGGIHVNHTKNVFTAKGTLQRAMECSTCGTDYIISNTAFIKMLENDSK